MDDPLVALGNQYATAAGPIVRVLRPTITERGDRRVLEALDTIESLCEMVASDLLRAAYRQSEANRLAEVARLSIDHSRRAWRVLMEPGRATGDGVPARLVAILDDLDVQTAKRFPQATGQG